MPRKNTESIVEQLTSRIAELEARNNELEQELAQLRLTPKNSVSSERSTGERKRVRADASDKDSDTLEKLSPLIDAIALKPSSAQQRKSALSMLFNLTKTSHLRTVARNSKKYGEIIVNSGYADSTKTTLLNIVVYCMDNFFSGRYRKENHMNDKESLAWHTLWDHHKKSQAQKAVEKKSSPEGAVVPFSQLHALVKEMPDETASQLKMYFELFKAIPVRSNESYKIKITQNEDTAMAGEDGINFIYLPKARNQSGVFWQINYKTSNNGERRRPLTLALSNRLRDYCDTYKIKPGSYLFVASRLKKDLDEFLKVASGDEKIQTSYLRKALASEHPDDLAVATAMNHTIETHRQSYVRQLKDAVPPGQRA